MRKVVVDIQFFKTEEKVFTPKELAVYDGTHISHYIFKPPFNFLELPDKLKPEAEWVTNNHHGISWDEGLVPVYLFPQILSRLLDNADRIYVKGREKANFVRNAAKKLVIEFPEEPALLKMEPSCFYHISSTCMCALSNVFTLYENFVMQ